MERLISKRFYLDHNATSPLADSVKAYLAGGDFLYGNPSSVHSSGKRSRRSLQQVSEYLFDLFDISSDEWFIFFHSGATEAINTFFKGFSLTQLKNKKRPAFFVAETDHSSVVNQESDLEALGGKFHKYGVTSSGEPRLNQLKEELEKTSHPTLLNHTWVNNETGVVWNLDEISKIKKEYDCFVHVDAVQAVGKIQNWSQLDTNLDAYTFSGHKFGAMKGVGFSLLKKSFPFHPLLRGGGQQHGLRSGTENTDGIYSLSLALNEMQDKQDFSELERARDFIQGQIIETLGDKIEIMGRETKRNANTISLCFLGEDAPKADVLLTALDLAGLDVSSGSACSSGSIEPSRVVMAMGKSEKEAKSTLRFSLSPHCSVSEAEEISQKIVKVLSRYA